MNHLTTYEHRVSSIEYRASSIRHWASCGENPTLAHFRHFSSLLTNPNRLSSPNSADTPNKPPILPRLSTNYDLFMQNKPNFRKSQMNVNKVLTRDYENKTLGGSGKNKPNTKPNKANSKPIKANLLNAQMNVNKVITRDYGNKSNWAICENKANTKPNKANFKLSASFVSSFCFSFFFASAIIWP